MFDWDEYNINHIAGHNLAPDEVEEAMTDQKRIRDNAYKVKGEKRFALIGSTQEGRLLFVVYTKRSSKFRPITARDANETQKRRYRRRR